ncbi:hypothetical protein C0389_00965 [bacterium]|nr:hypothetical protein [bacterium]
MKLSWGFNIAAFYITFVVLLLIVVFIFMSQDVGLVTDDYYAKEIAYQEEIDRTTRTKNLTVQLDIAVEPAQIKFLFPKIFSWREIGGTIHFYRPSDKEKDFIANISLDSSRTQFIGTENLKKGLWKIKVDWKAKGVSYFNEKIVMVN